MEDSGRECPGTNLILLEVVPADHQLAVSLFP